VACGATVAIWARFTIGTNWSGVVTLKEDHELVQAGPYRFVRHPIYSGILLMGLGTQIVYAEAFGFELLLFVSAVFAYKLRIEEDLMTEQFPSQYKEYRRHVKAIIPFLW
jgi:protein-S-isoprenylcysteine O-methyltransferase Ste14